MNGGINIPAVPGGTPLGGPTPGLAQQQPPMGGGFFPPNFNLNNISPQQKQQIVFLQHMRQGMIASRIAVAGGAGVGLGGSAATQ